MEIDKYTSEELNKIENTASLFSQIYEQTSGISKIVENHKYSAEELMPASQENNFNIQSLYSLMQDIKNSSSKLKDTIKEN